MGATILNAMSDKIPSDSPFKEVKEILKAVCQNIEGIDQQYFFTMVTHEYDGVAEKHESCKFLNSQSY
jgi:hypothetical protein